jgi:CheY-like chemotaxis protein
MSDNGKRVLIVDDKEIIRTTTALVLAEMGYSTRTAEDGFSALRAIHEECPDILLSDLSMPGMSGFELLMVVRRKFPTIHVIAMSGSFYGNDVPPGVLADAFHQKGSSLSALLQAFRSLPLVTRRASEPSKTERRPGFSRMEATLSLTDAA